ncbi:MAG: stage V sporulation protein E [Bacillota bacterium]|nr:stage V sporulation protein E [Bacillota bacterium]
MKGQKPVDFGIFITVLILLAFGIIMVASASGPSAYSYTKNHDIYFFLKKQLIDAGIGIVGMLIFMNIDYRKLGKLSPILLAICLFLLAVVWIPGVGHWENGARRWFLIGGQSIQPSELAKLAIIAFLAFSLSKRKDQLSSFMRGFVPYIVLLGVFVGFIMLEPHFSCVIIIVFVSVIILFCAGAKLKHFFIISIPAIAGLIGAVIVEPYRMARLVSFINPWNDIRGDGYQIVQSLYAIGSGGLFGKGLGKSLQKFLYIPEPQNDFILSILAEELGFIGVLVVLILFLIFIWRGIKIAMNAPDTFGSLLAVGITALIAVQVVLNVAVVTSSMPVTGMPLPFFSAGGTALVFLLCGVGVLLNISRYANNERI